MSENKYTFHGQVKAGAIGDNAQGILIDQSTDTGDFSDLPKWASELKAAQGLLQSQAKGSEQLKEVLAVSEAAEAAEKGDASGVKKALGNVSKWTFDIIKGTSQALLTAYLKTQLGLP